MGVYSTAGLLKAFEYGHAVGREASNGLCIGELIDLLDSGVVLLEAYASVARSCDFDIRQRKFAKRTKVSGLARSGRYSSIGCVGQDAQVGSAEAGFEAESFRTDRSTNSVGEDRILGGGLCVFEQLGVRTELSETESCYEYERHQRHRQHQDKSVSNCHDFS